MGMFKWRPEGVGTVLDGSMMKPAVTVISSASFPPYRHCLITGSIIALSGFRTLFTHHWARRQIPRRRLRPRRAGEILTLKKLWAHLHTLENIICVCVFLCLCGCVCNDL